MSKEFGNCGICLTLSYMKLGCCNAWYHFGCLSKWTQQKGYLTCPSCRYDFSPLCNICRKPSQNQTTKCCKKYAHANCLKQFEQIEYYPCCGASKRANPQPAERHQEHHCTWVCAAVITCVFIMSISLLALLIMGITGINVYNLSTVGESYECYSNRQKYCEELRACYRAENELTNASDNDFQAAHLCAAKIDLIYDRCHQLLPWIKDLVHIRKYLTYSGSCNL